MILLHYTKTGDTIGEYIVLVDQDEVSKADIREHCRDGFHLHTQAQVEGDNLHQLPVDVELGAI
jgi:hypothetical protein